MARTFILVTDFVFHESAWLKEVASRNMACSNTGRVQAHGGVGVRALPAAPSSRSNPPSSPVWLSNAEGTSTWGYAGRGNIMIMLALAHVLQQYTVRIRVERRRTAEWACVYTPAATYFHIGDGLRVP